MRLRCNRVDPFHCLLVSDVEIVRSALSSGQVSRAVAFIRWRHERDLSRKGKERDRKANLPRFDDFRRIAYVALAVVAHLTLCRHLLVYQAVVAGELDAAADMLGQLNEDHVHHFVNLLRFTTRRNVRHLLLAYPAVAEALRLAQAGTVPTVLTGIITPSFLRALKWGRLIEESYPNWEYTSEFFARSRRAAQRRAEEDPNQGLSRLSLKSSLTLFRRRRPFGAI